MSAMGINDFLALREAARTRIQTPSVQGAHKALQAKPAANAHAAQAQHPFASLLNTLGDAANRYISSTEDMEKKMANNEKFVKKTGNFIDIRA
jgi:hypothetical protein